MESQPKMFLCETCSNQFSTLAALDCHRATLHLPNRPVVRSKTELATPKLRNHRQAANLTPSMSVDLSGVVLRDTHVTGYAKDDYCVFYQGIIIEDAMDASTYQALGGGHAK